MTAMTDEKRVSDDRLREIIAGTKGVTPGPWSAEYDNSDNGEWYEINGPRLSQGWNQGRGSQMKIDAEHIARLDPQTVAAICSELLARRSQEPDGWRPIDSAPRHGERVLCGYWHRGNWVTRIAHARGPGEWLSDPGDWQVRPTHWRPLPAAPIPQSNEATKP